MQRVGWLGLVMVLMLGAAPNPAAAQAPPSGGPAPAPAAPAVEGPVYLITYFEVDGAAGTKTARLLRQFTAATRREAGNLGFLALREIARPGRFALLEGWRDKAAADAHGAATTALADKIKPTAVAPFDVRVNGGLMVGGPTIGAEPDANNVAVYVLTHADVFPAGKDQAVDMLKKLAEDSRKDPGNLRFDILQQAGRLNHLPIVEAWHNAGAQANHLMAEHTRAFRAKLLPLQGALFDERLYQAVR